MQMNKAKLLLFTLLFSTLSHAQERPKVGLALSGGGAKSMMHIGVIRELENQNIRPDYVTGTSMGAIIGAMYCMGFSADDIEGLLNEVDWDALLNNNIPRYRLSYLDRSSDDRYTLTLAIDSSGIKIPDAVNSGQYVLTTLSYLLQEVHDSTNFAKFNIPFSCITTNLETGEEVVFDSGDLAHVLRASSAFPSIFSPFELEGELHVDGGIKNNLPISLLREKGMDIIIASDAQSGLYTRDQLTNMVSILEQVGSYPNMENYREQLKDATVVIHPELDEFSIVSYEFRDEIIRRGAEATLEHSEELSQWAASEPLPERTAPYPSRQLYVDTIIVHGATLTSDRFVRSTLGIAPKDTTDSEDIIAGIERLYGSRFYKQVDYRIHKTRNGEKEMHIFVVESEDNTQARLGIHYDDDYKMGVLLNVTVRNALVKNSKFSLDFVLSENPRGELSYIFERGFIPAFGFKSDFHQFNANVYENGSPISEYTYTDFGTEIFLHSTLWDLYTIGGGVRFENIDISEPILRSEIQESNTTYLNYFGFIDFDSFDRTYKPTSGFQLNGEFKLISEQIDFKTYAEPISILHIQYDQAFCFSDRVGARTRILGATTIGPNAPYPYSIFLGSMGENYTQHIFPFVGYRYMELFGRNALTFRADVWYEAFPNHFFTAIANVGTLEATVDELFNSSVILDGYGISYGYKSPLGPLEITLSKSSNHSRIDTYVRLGFWF
ncbi:hypothetical protein F8C82_13430 [Phaeocystidibacter marisrubri]|uniref:PNPLA domain-containing protein n=2 Tax=Phaeocystidibacter marisrubri TaxID=1577780 RepID=A0A6L3ZD04_9FLAO|nr:hypothetical protein F8C82_13430 [Phaeocystidibacter marisrubri]